jgi:hypothetical protein
MGYCTPHVRFRGQSGHALLHCKCLLMTLSGHRGGLDDLIWEANKYPSSRQVRYDFGALPLAGGIVVQQTIARDECVGFTRACRHASAT